RSCCRTDRACDRSASLRQRIFRRALRVSLELTLLDAFELGVAQPLEIERLTLDAGSSQQAPARARSRRARRASGRRVHAVASLPVDRESLAIVPRLHDRARRRRSVEPAVAGDPGRDVIGIAPNSVASISALDAPPLTQNK